MNIIKNKLWICVLIGLWSCNTEGHRGSSDSIKDSKQRGTFIGQYDVHLISDSADRIIDDKTDEVFIEYSWFIRPPESIVDTTCINIVIKTSKSEVDILTTKYQIRNSQSNFSRHSKHTLWYCDGDEKLQPADSIKFKMFKNEKYINDLLFVRITKDE